MSDYPYPVSHEEGQPYGPLATFKARGILPPSGVYITQDDTIQLRSWAPLTAQTVRVTLRILNNGGIVVPTQTTIVVTANGATVQLNTIEADEGFLISASIDGDATRRGFCFCQLVIRRGLGSGDSTLGSVLCSGYVSQYDFLAWPNGTIASSVDGRGGMRIVIGTNPAAGAEVSETVPGGVEWIVRSVAVALVTSAAAGTRRPALVFDDGAGNTVGHSVIASGVGAGVSLTIAWSAGVQVQTGNVIYSAPLVQEVRLRSGWRILTSTNAIDVGDDYGAPRMLVEEFISQ